MECCHLVQLWPFHSNDWPRSPRNMVSRRVAYGLHLKWLGCIMLANGFWKVTHCKVTYNLLSSLYCSCLGFGAAITGIKSTWRQQARPSTTLMNYQSLREHKLQTENWTRVCYFSRIDNSDQQITSIAGNASPWKFMIAPCCILVTMDLVPVLRPLRRHFWWWQILWSYWPHYIVAG